jgi:dephospho-CoA kinase
MKKIGLTGGIGSGKTTVCKIFQSIGIPVYYADPRAKALMSFDPVLKAVLKKELGPEIYHRNGRLNRKVMANLIFNNKDKLNTVNALVHPAVNRDSANWMKDQDASYCIYEAALLIENGSYKNFDKLIVVTAPEELRVYRVMKRDRITKEQVLSRISSQLPQDQKNHLADYLIINDGDHSLIQQVADIHRDIIINN